MLGISFTLAATSAYGQVPPPPITPSGLNTQVSAPTTLPNGQINYNITGGTRPGGGPNLFHSFGNFNVPTNNIANFLNETPTLATSNILGRVTGGNISNIFGTIQTTGFGNANLFLMNPAGFLFGPNATVNVGGMVAFTSADYLRLADGGRFNANPNAIPANILTSAPVAAFGFLGSNPGAITVQGSQFTVAKGTGISLVGGSITVQSGTLEDGTIQPARLSAPGGQVNLASVASPGEILLANLQSAPNINGQSFTAMGNISLSEGALLDVSADAAGTVRVRGGHLVMEQATISADTVNSNGSPVGIDINMAGDVSISNTDVPALTARTTGSGNAGAIQIASANMDVVGIAPNSIVVSVIDTHTSGTGKAGDVSITTGNLNALGDPFNITYFIDSGTSSNSVDSSTSSTGPGGNLTISAKDVKLESSLISTGDNGLGLSEIQPSGPAGNVKISTNSLNMLLSGIGAESFIGTAGNITLAATDIHLDTTTISAAGFARGGTITLNADSLVLVKSLIASTSIGSPGPGGGITVSGNVIELTTGSQLLTSTFGDGDAGPIRVTATDHLSLSGSQQDLRPSGIFSNSFGVNGTLGNAGNIFITTPRLEITDGARINTVTNTSGRGGNVSIDADTVSLSGQLPAPPAEPIFGLGSQVAGGIFTSTIGSIASCSGPCGEAGRISITTGSLTVGSGSQIDSGTSSSGLGGNITINAANTISLSGTLLDGAPVGVFSRSIGMEPGSGSGGNIELLASQIQVTNGAQISASTLGSGNAGNITLQGPSSPAQSVLIDGAGSGIFTETRGTGAGGDILVNADTLTISNGGTLSAKTSGTAASAVGGTIKVEAPSTVTMTNGASITASSTGAGNTGNIQINAGNQFAMTNSTVTTEANQSGGGVIKITTNPDGTVQLTDSTISASVLDGNGGGGSVNIDPQSVVLINSQILANAVFGPGGNINITTNLLLPDATSLISASSQFGQQGTVIIQSPISPASGKIVPLGQKPLLPTSLLSQRCAAIAGGNISSFTVAGRDSLPAEPAGWVSTPLALSMSESEDGTVREVGLGTTSNEALEETPLLSLRKIAPPGFLTQSFAVDSSAGCAS